LDPQFFISDLGTELQIGLPKLHEWIHREVIKSGHLARGSFATYSEEHNWYEHFQLLMRHPIINAGVQIAAWHHYRLPEDLLST
jgi:hypothetical protein